MAADLGSVEGMNAYGNGLEKGFLGEKYPSEAISYYKKAAKLHHPDGMFNYAISLCKGYDGQSPQYEKAMKLFKELSDEGFAEATYQYARGLEHGYLGVKDPIAAKEYYEIAASNGYQKAKKKLN